MTLSESYKHAIYALEHGIYEDPFGFLGPHKVDEKNYVIRCFMPEAEHVSVELNGADLPMERIGQSDLFEFYTGSDVTQIRYHFNVHYPFATESRPDVYRFGSSLSEQDSYLFNQGTLEQGNTLFGANWLSCDDEYGVRFTLWAPNAKRVAVVGDFNHWDKRTHGMRKHPASGIWELFVPNLNEGCNYKFHLVTLDGSELEKADPYATQMQKSPATASVVPAKSKGISAKVLAEREQRNRVDAPISIYEVHLGSWRRKGENGKDYLSYRDLAEQLIPYAKSLNFSHIQLMPISEFPFDGSWGYQPVGLFAPTSRFGSPDDFQYFVNACHEAGLGLLLDWVPGHFPSDPHGIAQFDGTHLYEHADKRQGYHPDWNTHIYNYDRPEVQSYILSNALYWLDNFAIDGLRVDAVASMLYLDYSRKEGEWVPNHHGGRENIGAIELLKKVNQRCYQSQPGVMMVAEESTAWPGVTQMTEHGGLGFGYKWNMGWMNDSLSYMAKDPLYRKHHHNEMTFSLVYAYSENYILPLSHDEVVHGKGSMINKMPGDQWQKFANLRAYYGYMWAHPGKKLLFMGCEFAQYDEWNHDKSLDWHLTEHNEHQGVQTLIKDLNQTYQYFAALHELDNHPTGFSWVDGGNAEQSIFSFIRYAKSTDEHILVVCNMTPNTYKGYRLGVPNDGSYQLVLNTDDTKYGGSGFSQSQCIQAQSQSSHGHEHSVEIDIAPLATMYFRKVKQ